MFDNKPLEMLRMWTEAFRSLSMRGRMRMGKVVLLYCNSVSFMTR